MAYEQRDNSGSLFKNQKKESESHPNATGSAMIDGVEFWVSAWTKKDKNGNPWQSLSFRRKDEAQGAPKARRVDAAPPESDDIPFSPLRGI